MHLARARAAHHPHDLPARRPADGGIVHEDDALALENAPHRTELDPNAEVTDRLLRLDEGASHVVVANQPHAHRDARGFGVAEAADRKSTRLNSSHVSESRMPS